ncbi:Neural cell adhesion molecule 1 [Acropora cervicornis]|uniref:Neural cell adhesion molecule 1 n=1 Tax=Acropora cervicornis TaxID=6130 RepID=A0AAD9QT89_ACRCE|nr:Neural cell adhesion molecule 1 [Acropora cervicornis]
MVFNEALHHKGWSSRGKLLKRKKTLVEEVKAIGNGALAGIVIAVILVVLIAIDLFCCFFNSCGLFFCCKQLLCKEKGATKASLTSHEI